MPSPTQTNNYTGYTPTTSEISSTWYFNPYQDYIDLMKKYIELSEKYTQLLEARPDQ